MGENGNQLLKRGQLLQDDALDTDSDFRSRNTSDEEIEGDVFDLDIKLQESEVYGLSRAFHEFMDPETGLIDFFELLYTLEKKDIA